LGNRADATDASLLNTWLDAGLSELTTRRIEIQELQGSTSPIISQIGVSNYARPAGIFSIRYLEETTGARVLTRFPGGFEEFLRAKQNATNGIPSQFGEWGGQFFLLPPPDLATYSYTPYVYNLATWGTSAGDTPSIGTMWDRGVLLLAEMIAFQDLGDEDRAMAAEQQFETWWSQRDTSMRQARRFSAPTRGIQPTNATRRDHRTGV
jgi:hypothetical protein